MAIPIFVKSDRKAFHAVQDVSDDDHVSYAKKFKALFDFKTNLGESFGSAMKKRAGSVRHLVLLLLAIFAVLEFVVNGERTADLLYVRLKFPWGKYTNVCS